MWMAIWLWNSLRQSFSSVKKMKDYCHSLGLEAANVISVKSVCVLQDAPSLPSCLNCQILKGSSLVTNLSHAAAELLHNGHDHEWQRSMESDDAVRGGGLTCLQKQCCGQARFWSKPAGKELKKEKKKRNFKWNLLLGRFSYSDQLDWQYKGGTDWLLKKFKVPAD